MGCEWYYELEKLSPEKQTYIRESHETDTSGYLVDTRPVLFQIQGVEDDQDQHRGPVHFNREVEVMIYCFGEWKEGGCLLSIHQELFQVLEVIAHQSGFFLFVQARPQTLRDLH